MVYIIILLLTFVAHLVFDGKTKNNRTAKYFYYLEFIVLFLVVGLRFRIGADSLSYEDNYNIISGISLLNEYSFSTSGNGLLWYAFIAFCQTIGKEWIFLQLLHAFIITFAVFYFIKKHCTMPFLAIFFYAIFNYLYLSTEILRASMAVAIFLLWGYDALIKKKWVYYFISAFIATNFHIEGIAIFLFPLVYYLGTMKMNVFRFIGILVISVIILNALNLDSLLDSIAQYTESELIESRVNSYSVESLGNTNSLIAKLITLLPVFFCLWGSKFIDHNNRYSRIVRGFLIIYTIGSVLTLYYPAFFSRMIDCLRIVYVVAFADILGALLKRNEKSLYIIILILGFFCEGFMHYREETIIIRYYPYSSIISPVIVPEREYLFSK